MVGHPHRDHCMTSRDRKQAHDEFRHAPRECKEAGHEEWGNEDGAIAFDQLGIGGVMIPCQAT